MNWLLFLIPVGLAVAFAVAVEIAERRRDRILLDRPCAGIRWHRRFPSVPHDDIRSFLSLFTEAFDFHAVHACKFAPDDQPLAIYEARYISHVPLDDRMEFELLEDYLESRYGINLETVWHEELTLGELFLLTRSADQRPSATQ